MESKYAELVQSNYPDLEENSNRKKPGLSLSYRMSLSVEMNARGGPNSGGHLRGRKTKEILDDVFGVCQQGQMLGVMGPSGAGKTSLLNCLSLRNKRFRGYVLHNGEPPDLDTLAIDTAFVQQRVLFLEVLTPREHLTFNATLRMGNTVTKDQLRDAVDKSLEGMGLVECADTLIGGKGSLIRGISGGQKKRLAFAVEMLGEPKIIFADEPTTGLDSHMALVLVSRMRALADRGMTVVATIHQPSSQVFKLFSHLHLLAEGRTVYMGERAQAVNFFAGIGYPCRPAFNPADFFMSVLGKVARHNSSPSKGHVASMRSPVTEGRAEVSTDGVLALAQAFCLSEEAAKVLDGLPPEEDVPKKLLEAPGKGKNIVDTRIYQAPWIKQLAEVYTRSLRTSVRDTSGRLIRGVALGLGFGLLFFQLGTSQEDAQGIMGVTFFTLMVLTGTSAMQVVQVFVRETPLLLQEHDSGLYSISAYFVGRTMAEMPAQIAFSTSFALIVGALTHITHSNTAFLTYVLLMTLAASTNVSLGYLISSLSKDIGVGSSTVQFVQMIFLLTGGLFLNTETVPTFIQWLPQFSPTRNAYSAISLTVWREIGTSFGCPQGDKACRFPDINAVLEYLHFQDDRVVYNILWLVGQMLGFRLLAFFIISYRSRPSGKREY